MTRIPHNRPSLGEREAAAAHRVVSSGYVASGPETAAFEDEFCAYLGLDSGHAVAVSSGTAALYLTLEAFGARGKRVGVSRYTCSSVGHAVALAGASSIPIDIVSDDHADMDLDALRAAAPQLAIVAHLFGIPQRLDGFSMPVIEDCAQSLGARAGGRPVGLQGDAGVFSFYATKMITAGGQGGMVVARDRRLVESVRELLAYNLPDTIPKMNFHSTDVQSAIARVQLQRLEEFRERREGIFEKYLEAGIPLMVERDAHVAAVRYRAVVVDDRVAMLARALDAAGIDTRVPIKPEELEDAPGGTHAAALALRSLFLPIFAGMQTGEVNRVIEGAGAVLSR